MYYKPPPDEADLLDANIGGEVRVVIENGTIVQVYR